MVDVLLIQPPIRDFYLTYKRTIPHGLACIAASLEKEGLSVQILDGLATAKSRIVELPAEMMPLEKYYRGPDRSPISLFHHYRHFGYSLEYIGQRAKAASASLIGISSLFTAYGDMSLKVARHIRKLCPTAKIVLGGHHATTCPESIVDCDAVDYVLRGEGEVSMPALALALRDRTPLESVPGIVFRKNGDDIHISPPAVMADLDKFPRPGLHLLKNDYYKRSVGRTMVIMTSRGCPMRCSYCSVGNSPEIPYRRRKEAQVLAEIEAAIENNGVRFIDFEDEHLTLKRKSFIRFLEQLIDRFDDYGLELRAMNGLYPPSLDAEMVKLMKRAGFKALNLSLCTTSSDQLQRFNRPDVTQAFDRILDVAEALNLDTVGYIIVGAPGQDPLASVADLLHLAHRNVIAGVSVYYPAPGSSDFAICRQQGLLPETESLFRSSAIPISDSTSRRDSVTLLRLGRILNFMKHLDEHPDTRRDTVDPEVIRSGSRDRLMDGVHLLQMFFKDGHIRGITPDGDIFEHEVSLDLTGAFIDGFRKETRPGQRWREETLKNLFQG